MPQTPGLTRWIPIALLLALVSACAPKVALLPAPGAAHYPEFMKPAVPVADAASISGRQVERAWLFLQAGDLRGADRELAVALKASPAFYPAQSTSAYLALARSDARAAVNGFTQVVAAHPDYVPALVGQGLALQADNRNTEAIAAFRAAVKADPSLLDLARRIDVLTLRGQQEQLAAARDAARSGRRDEAIGAYRKAIAASPESAFLYRELANVERDAGKIPAAVEDLKQATSLDPTDAGSLAVLGALLDEQGDAEGALKAYDGALALENNPDVASRRDAIRVRLELARLPEQYRAIDSSPQITRADLAALIGVRLDHLLAKAAPRDVGILTDIRGHWAEQWITEVTRAGILEPFPNHTFQPRTLVRRVDLAQAVSRLLNVAAAANPSQSALWTGARGRFTDISAGHIAYPAVSAAVAAGAMDRTPDGAFQPGLVVTGEDAIAALDRVRVLAGLPATLASDRR
jgi:tetratricopeptide (TPR) repeat protein